MWTHKRTTALSVRLLNTKLSTFYSRCHTCNVVFDIASKNMDWWQRTNNPAKWKGGKAHTCSIVTTFHLKTFDNKYKSIQLTLRAIITLVHVVDHMFWSLNFRAAFSLTRRSNYRHAPWHVNIILAACKSNEMICANVCMLRDTGQPKPLAQEWDRPPHHCSSAWQLLQHQFTCFIETHYLHSFWRYGLVNHLYYLVRFDLHVCMFPQ